MPRFDHHIHTSRHSPDSCLDPLELIERAREVGLDGIVITEHDYQWHRDELAELSARAHGLTILSGAEISAREGHFLVYGLPDLEETPAGITLSDLIEVVRLHKAAIVAAHPFRWGQEFDRLVDRHGPVFDALELVSNNVSTETRAMTARLVKERAMAATGSSDGHEAEVIGCYFSEFTDPIATMADFVSGLKGKRVRPRHRPGAFLFSGPVD
jgi:predicted metal-dependent phosphoesterase TrpH